MTVTCRRMPSANHHHDIRRAPLCCKSMPSAHESHAREFSTVRTRRNTRRHYAHARHSVWGRSSATPCLTLHRRHDAETMASRSRRLRSSSLSRLSVRAPNVIQLPATTSSQEMYQRMFAPESFPAMGLIGRPSQSRRPPLPPDERTGGRHLSPRAEGWFADVAPLTRLAFGGKGTQRPCCRARRDLAGLSC